MQRKILLGAFAFLFALAFVAPANALNVGGTDYTLLANKRIGMESGPTVINGNVLVNDPAGVLQIGSNVKINGTATANKIEAGTGSLTTTCQFNVKTGSGVCTNSVTPVALPIFAWPPLPIAALPACVDVAAPVTVPANGTVNLVAGCYGLVTVNDGGTLNLGAGTFNVLDLAVGQNATVAGAGVSSTIVNSKKVVTFQGGDTIKDVTVETPLATTAEVIQIGAGAQLDNALMYAPFGKIHVHFTTVGLNAEIVSNTMQVEPSQFNNVPKVECACFTEVTKSNSTTIHVKGENLSVVTSYVLSHDCNTAGGTVATPAGPGTNTDIDLTIPQGLNPGTYHVIGVSAGRTFCSAQTITIP